MTMSAISERNKNLEKDGLEEYTGNPPQHTGHYMEHHRLYTAVGLRDR